MPNELMCYFCRLPYDLVSRTPRVMKECGHSICESCLSDFI